MKTKEFIKRVEELGFRITIPKYGDIGDIINVEGYGTDSATWDKKWLKLAELRTDLVYSLEISNLNFLLGGIDRSLLNELYKTLVEYDIALVNEREEEKKYYLRHRWTVFGATKCDDVYLKLHKENYYLNMGNKENGFIKTKFTQKEIDEIKEKFDTDLKDFEMIEVEEWKQKNL